MAKLRRLKIEKFRNVVPGTELRFHDGFNVLLGQNGTGKTNLLKLIAMALTSDFSSLEDEAFAIEYDIETPHGSLGIEIRYRPSIKAHGFPGLGRDRMEATREQVGATAEWSYRAHIEAADRTELCRIEANQMGAIARLPAQPAPVTIPNAGSLFTFVLLDMALTQLAVRVAQPMTALMLGIYGDLGRIVDRFDEALGAFEGMVGHGPSDGNATSGKYLDFWEYGDPRRPRPASINALAIRVPRAVVQQIEAEELAIGDERLVLNHEGLPFLEKTIQLCGFVEGHMTIVRESLKPHQGGVVVRYSDFSFSFTLDDGTIITHKDLSYGQKRLLSFLYHLALNDDVVVADELVNGLHYDWIETCIEEIGDRQAFLTSQNPILLDFLPFESAEQVRQSFLLCKLERREGGSVMVWKNLEQDAAEEFYRSYRTRALQVSEILRTQGLW